MASKENGNSLGDAYRRWRGSLLGQITLLRMQVAHNLTVARKREITDQSIIHGR